MAIGQTKALVVNDKTQTAVSCCGHLCTLEVLRWDGTDTHHTEARAQRFKSSYDVILEGENNKHFVTTKQCTVLAQTQHTTKPFLGCHLDRKQHIKVKTSQAVSQKHGTGQDLVVLRRQKGYGTHGTSTAFPVNQRHNSLERLSSCLGVIRQSARKT